jgi:hypothetical protein
MVFKDGELLLSYGVMGGDVQTQGHVHVLVNLVDRAMNLQQAIEAPRVRYMSGRLCDDDGGGGGADRAVDQRSRPSLVWSALLQQWPFNA